MFGGLVNLLQPSIVGPPPGDVPPPTPVKIPDCKPQLSQDRSPHPSVVRLLQSIQRPTELNEAHFAALGVHVLSDAAVEDLVPDLSFLPTASAWDDITLDQARARDSTFRRPLSNGNLSPEARVYLDRRNELLIDNQAAFRTIRRIRPEPGMKTPRLGNCYEFFKQLEQMATYWDDTSLPPGTHEQGDGTKEDESKPPDGAQPMPVDASLEQAEPAIIGASTAAESNSRSEPKDSKPHQVTYRTAPGNTMPAEMRHNLISAFIKLVSYDFGCNISGPRVEPRLHLLEPSLPAPEQSKPSKHAPREPHASYFPSGCVFLVRTPMTREAARSGVVEGPLAAVSARNTTNFSTSADHCIDFGRELVAALVTAQHRAREGQDEKRFGDGKWWATTKRWGGGSGGPIGRELEGAAGIVSDKDKSPTDTSVTTKTATETEGASPTSPQNRKANDNETRPQSPPHPISPSSGLPMRGPPVAKRARKNHVSVYDNYRQVRLPSSNWDKKARYSAVGKVKGADYDDVFVISSLFHHISVLRVRVPKRLLEVLAGASEEDGVQSWGKLPVWRSKWYDLFIAKERLEALRLLWGMTAWLMRKEEGTNVADVIMKGT
ncbi:hypothetical protein BJ170DRAFT_643779 [Xylariales sp. AK1849]|nr:hypothetical protein BJ170DRAFT_643779 [Xylariales sp. AK1849]